MAENSKFFDSVDGDVREYTATEFTDYFKRFLSNGVYTVDGTMGLKVEVSNGLNIKVTPGLAYVEGKEYENDSEISFTLDPADNILDRIDRVVLRLDMINRTINMKLKKGSISSAPLPPSLVENTDIMEIAIAQIRVNKAATTGIVIDERRPVSSLIEIPYEDMVAEFNDWFENVRVSKGVEVYLGKTESDNMAIGDVWFKEMV